MSRPCECNGPKCRRCWLWANDPRYRVIWGGDPAGMSARPVRKARPRKPDCVHLGAVLPRESGKCGQRLRKCDVFGSCTLHPCDKSPHSCNRGRCPSYESA